ncbi:hypothetical protein G9A89_023559 [Geosiphon pyriformis]|nr:hypothetical protein G9A89_023559 [Geosiphon pyriformis]
MVDATGNIRKMEITDNIHSLVQQLFQLIQHQEMEITINQQTIRYQDTRKIFQFRTQKKTENTVDKIMAKVKLAIKESTKEAMDLVTSNQLGKITNAQFEELQTQITQVILENKIQEILQKRELHETQPKPSDPSKSSDTAPSEQPQWK